MKHISSKAMVGRDYFLFLGIIFLLITNSVSAQGDKGETISNFISRYIPLAGWILGISFFIYLLSLWDKYSKDEEGKGFIAPEYEVPDNLTPIEVSAIVYEKVTYNSIFAELVYLATKEYIQIRQVDVPLEMFPKKIAYLAGGGLIGKDFSITLCKDPSTLQNLFDQKLLERIFDYGITENGVKVLYLSRVSNSFYFDAENIGIMAAEGLQEKGYYKYLGKLRKNTILGIIPSHLIFPCSTYVAYVVLYIIIIDESFRVFYFLLGIIIAIIFFAYISPAKTQKGVYAKESLLGLKKYLNIFEEDRIYFNNAPDKRPDRFEELLPFAMVLGVDTAWVREFEGIYENPSAPSKVDLITLSKFLLTQVN